MTSGEECLRYVAYGSNLHPLRLQVRTPSAQLIGSARIADFGLRFHKRGKDESGKCNIVPDAVSVYVAIYEISSGERKYLDRIEGLGIGYDEHRLIVPGVGDCFTYVANGTHIKPQLSPYSWYKELVLAGCQYHGFPMDYQQRIKDVAAQCDKNTVRHAENMALVGKLRNGA